MKTLEATYLGSLQVELMKLLWQHGAQTVQELLDRWPAVKTPAYVTILTVLRRLEARGYLTHDMRGRAFVYRPLREAPVVKGQILADLTRRVFGSPVALVEQLLVNGVDAGDRARIAQLAQA